jgi:hypothetical protein
MVRPFHLRLSKAPGKGKRLSVPGDLLASFGHRSPPTVKKSGGATVRKSAWRNPVRSLARSWGEIAFGQCLQPPGDPPEGMFPVAGSRFFLKYLPKLLAADPSGSPDAASQFPSISQNASSFPLRGRQPQSHERSLPPHTQVLSE